MRTRKLTPFLAGHSLNLLTVFVIFFLFFVLILDLRRTHYEMSASYERLLTSLLESGIEENIDNTLRSIGAKLDYPPEGSLTPSSQDYSVEVIEARRLSPGDAENRLGDLCPLLQEYSNNVSTYKCALLLDSPLRSGSDSPGAYSEESRILAQELSDLYHSVVSQQENDSQVLSVENSILDSDNPLVLSVYGALRRDRQYGAVTYPTFHPMPLEHIHHRETTPPWSKEGIEAKLEVSEVKINYFFRRPAALLTKTYHSSYSQATVGVEILIPVQSQPINAYLLNLLLTVLALVMYIRYYLSLSDRFILFLVLSTVCLLFAYIVLVAAKLQLIPSQDTYLVTRVLAFLPTGSLLVVSGLALVARSKVRLIASFIIAYLAEIITGITNHVFESSWASTLFGATCLVFFGFCLLNLSASYSRHEAKDLVLKPRILGTYTAIAYIIWGLGQIPLLFLGGEGLILLGRLQRFNWWANWMDSLAMDSGIFLLLFYFKMTATIFTILYLSSLAGVQFKRLVARGRDAILVPLDDSGHLLGKGNLPIALKVLRGASLKGFIKEQEQVAEVGHRFRSGSSVKGIICRMPTFFGGEWVRLSVAEVGSASTAASRMAHIVALRRERLLQAVDNLLRDEVLGLANRVQVYASMLPAKDQAGSIPISGQPIAQLRANTDDTFERMWNEAASSKNRLELLEQLKDLAIVTKKRYTRTALLLRYLRSLCRPGHARGNPIVKRLQRSQKLPRELLINYDYLVLVLRSIFRSWEDLREAQKGSVDLTVMIMPPQRGDRFFGGDRFRLELVLTWMNELSNEEVQDFLESDSRISSAREILSLFDGELTLRPHVEKGVSITVQIEYCHSR